MAGRLFVINNAKLCGMFLTVGIIHLYGCLVEVHVTAP